MQLIFSGSFCVWMISCAVWTLRTKQASCAVTSMHSTLIVLHPAGSVPCAPPTRTPPTRSHTSLPAACSYILFALITLSVLLVPPITLFVDPWVRNNEDIDLTMAVGDCTTVVN